MREEILRLNKVTRSVDDVPVLENINLHLFRGEILGMICLNDYGQEELVRLLQQNLPLDYGKIYLCDQLVNSYDHSTMGYNRIAVIDHQNKLVDDLTVTDNVFVLRRGFKKYFINNRQLDAQLQQYLDEVDAEISGSQMVSDLTPYQRCVVELLRAVVLGIRLIVIRNITNHVSTADLHRFQQLLRVYAQQGFSFFYVCNHHEEAFKVCDRIALLQNTRIRRVLDSGEFFRENIEPYYLDTYRRLQGRLHPHPGKEDALQFRSLRTGSLRDLSLSVQEGECVVLLDFDHTALDDVMRVMNGEIAARSGEVWVEGRRYSLLRAKQPVRSGVAFVPQYPATSMLFRELSYLDNLCFLLDKKRSRLHMTARVRRSVVREYGRQFGPEIHRRDLYGLSRASLYRLAYGRVALARPKVVFCVQPFSDADIQLRSQIIRQIRELKAMGAAVVILAVNLSDSLMVADRMVIVRQGRVLQEYPRSEFHNFSKDATIV